MNKTKLIERLQTGHKFVESAFADFSEVEKNQSGTLEHWAPKDVLAHITSWQKRWLDWLEPIAQGKEPDASGPGAGISDENAANAEAFAVNQHRSWRQLWQESQSVFERTLSLVNLLSDDDINNPERFLGLKGRPFWKSVGGNFYWHVQVHLGNMYIDRGQIDRGQIDRGQIDRGQIERGQQIIEGFAAQVGADEPASERGETIYNLACYYSLAGFREKAIGHLKTALSLNPALIEWSKQDTDLDSMRGIAEFQALYLVTAESK